jgi:hypothetical protein
VAWSNGPIRVYHGTDHVSAAAVLGNGVDLALCSPLTDFGRGFYTTSNLEQAKNWGLLRARRLRAKNPDAKGAVIEMQVDRDWLSRMCSLVFVREAPEIGYWDFVRFCRTGNTPHRVRDNYEVVYGPVAMWQDLVDDHAALFTIKDCDQISFHSVASTSRSSRLFESSGLLWSEP